MDEMIEMHVELHADKVVLHRPRGIQPLTTRLDLDDTRRATLDLFVDWLRQKNKITNLKELKVLGRHLFDAVFNGDVAAELKKHVSARKKVRIQLSFAESGLELAEYPWEFMFWSARGRPESFLAAKTGMVLSRLLLLEEPRQTLNANGKQLRVLLVVSKPEDPDLHKVDETSVLEAFTKVAAELKQRGLKTEIQLSPLLDPTTTSLEKAIDDLQPHVVHFMGHGRFVDGKGQIALVREHVLDTHWVEDAAFADLLVPRKDGTEPPRLVVLHMCEGAVVDFRHSFRGMAPQLILGGIRAVVAMQYGIPDQDAQWFTDTFYECLARPMPVDAALQHARWRLSTEANPGNARSFGTPVLYLHSTDGALIDLSREESSQSSTQNPPKHAPPIAASSENRPDQPGNAQTPAVAEPPPALQAGVSPLSAPVGTPGVVAVRVERLDAPLLAELWPNVTRLITEHELPREATIKRVAEMVRLGEPEKILDALGRCLEDGPDPVYEMFAVLLVERSRR